MGRFEVKVTRREDLAARGEGAETQALQCGPTAPLAQGCAPEGPLAQGCAPEGPLALDSTIDTPETYGRRGSAS